MSSFPDDFPALAQTTLQGLSAYVQKATQGQGAGTGFAPLEQIVRELKIEEWIAHGGMDQSAYQEFLERYLGYSVQIHHPHYLAHQVATPDTPGIVAGMINAVMQNPMAIYEMGPAAAAMEFGVIRWMCEKIGWPAPEYPYQNSNPTAQAGGVLTHGGSLANLTALLAARSKIAPQSWSQGVGQDLAIMAPSVSHYSVARAASVLGIGAKQVFAIPTDEYGVVRVDALESTLSALLAQGRRCMAVVANACSTATGKFDPLRAMGEFCQRHQLWFHVDACHGASGLLSPRLAKDLDGIDLADSVVWDAHKMMQIPVLCAALLVRDAGDLRGIFSQDANYLAFEQDPERYSALPFAIECTKSSMSLKVFLSLAFRGQEGLARYIEDRYAMAKRYYEVIQARPGFTCLCEPQTNILCFRYGQEDALQDKIRDRLLRERSYHLSSATVAGKSYLRMTLMNPRSDLAVLERLLDQIEATARTLDSSANADK